MEAIAKLRGAPISAQKVRLVLDLVRGKDANEALETLRFVPSHAAEPVLKLLKSAVANAKKKMERGLSPPLSREGMRQGNPPLALYL